jgi:hypothetical protein
MTRLLRSTLVFLAIVSCVYALLMIPWTGLPEAYGGIYRRAANALAQGLPLDAGVSFHAIERLPAKRRASLLIEGGHRLEEYDSYLVARRPRSTQMQLHPWSTRYFGYMSTATLAALVLATPITWRRRIGAVAAGLLLLNGLLMLQLAANLLLHFSREPLLGWPFPGTLRSLLPTLAFPAWYLLPVASWIAVTLPSEIRRLNRAAAGLRARPGTGGRARPVVHRADRALIS